VWPDANHASSLTVERLNLYLYGLVALPFSATGAHAEESTKIPPLLVAAHDYRIARAA
jgi:hypothetical protein